MKYPITFLRAKPPAGSVPHPSPLHFHLLFASFPKYGHNTTGTDYPGRWPPAARFARRPYSRLPIDHVPDSRIRRRKPVAYLFHRGPSGNIPFFLALTRGATPEERRRTAFRASLDTFRILLFFAFVGEWILRLLRVTISSFRIAGGILIFIIALSMLQARRSRARSTPEEEHDRREREDVSIFPLAIPMMSGPAAITTVMVLISISKSYTRKALVILGILPTSVACYWILRESGRLLKILRQTGINVLSRLMGLLLAVIAVQFVVDGIKAVLAQVGPPK